MLFINIDTAQLIGTYVYLEHLHQNHIPVLKELTRDERLWEFTKTLLINETFDAQFDKYIVAALDEHNTGSQCSFIIRRTEDGAVIGMTRFYKIEPAHKRLSIGYTWYVPAVWGKVHNKECKLLLLQYAFEKLNYQRIEFEVAHLNVRSQKAVEKIGGVKEGVLRKHGLQADGSVRDTVVFSIVDDEWPQKKEALLRWVAAG